jgi:DNA modification methylase
MGIGTTALACVKLGVKFIGFEIDSSYVEIAKEKLTQEKLLQYTEESTLAKSRADSELF